MNKVLCTALVLLGVLSLAACSSATKEKLGIAKKAPDEFMVVPRAPLSLPPEYNLRPVVEPQSEAGRASVSEGEQALLDKVGSEK